MSDDERDDQPAVACSLCGEETTDYCYMLTCRRCHVSLTIDECNATNANPEATRALLARGG